MVGKNTGVGVEVESDNHSEPLYTCKLLVLILNKTKPVAGFSMPSLCVVVILGGKSPFVVLLTSNCADVAGVLVPIPTFCPMPAIVNNKKAKLANAFFMFVCLYNSLTRSFFTKAQYTKQLTSHFNLYDDPFDISRPPIRPIIPYTPTKISISLAAS